MSECRCHGGYCQCLLVDTNCVAVTSVDPYEVELVVDPDPDNLVVAGPAGLRATMPRDIENPPATAAVRSGSSDTDLLLPGGQPQFIKLLDQLWDTRGFISVTNPKQWVISVPGMYVATGSFNFDPRFDTAANHGDRRVWVVKNGIYTVASSQVQSPVTPPTGSETFIQVNASGLCRMEANDWFSLRVYHGSPTALKSGSAFDEMWAAGMSICRVGGAAA